LFSRPEILILSSLGTERQVGFYAAALKLFEAWTVVSESFLASTFPRLVALAKRSRDEMLSFARDASGAVAAVSVALVVALVAFADDILVAVFGDAFAGAATTLRIGAPSMVFYGLFSLHWRVLAALDKQPTVLRIQLMTAPLRIVLGVILTLLAGAAGAAASATISLGVHTTIQGRAAFPGPWRSLVRPTVHLGVLALTVGLPTYLGDVVGGFPGGVVGWGLGCLVAATRVTPETVSFFRYRMEI
jgi:O-antigen/teichoic acid export membrane protein